MKNTVYLTPEKENITLAAGVIKDGGLVCFPTETVYGLGANGLDEKAVADICQMHGVQCWNGASEACLGYHRTINDDKYIRDQIHLTDEGGKVLAQYYWGKLKNVYPLD